MVLPVRVGDSFVADSNHFAQGVVFAVDSGAHVVQEALGAVNNTSFARAAIDYAWSNDVPVIASAADEESFHHNCAGGQPPHHHGELGDPLRRASGFTMSPHVVSLPERLHELRRQHRRRDRVVVVLVGGDRARLGHRRAAHLGGARPRRRGHARSRAATDPTGAVHPLSADEVAQLLTMTADDIDFSRRPGRVASSSRAFGIESHALRVAARLGPVLRLRPRQRPPRRRTRWRAARVPPEADLLDARLVADPRPRAHAGGHRHRRCGRDARRAATAGSSPRAAACSRREDRFATDRVAPSGITRAARSRHAGVVVDRRHGAALRDRSRRRPARPRRAARRRPTTRPTRSPSRCASASPTTPAGAARRGARSTCITIPTCVAASRSRSAAAASRRRSSSACAARRRAARSATPGSSS